MKGRSRSLWFAAVGLAGLGFGLIGERRPFGQDPLTSPLMLYVAAVAAGLLVLRFALRRPVPEVIPERALVLGCVLGLAAFLAGNFAATHLLR